MRKLLIATVLAALATAAVAAPGAPLRKAPADARAYIISPADGARVGREVTVRFGLAGMGVAPAGVDREHTGHHHLLVDVATLPPAGQPIPNDEHHRHFGGGQTETVLQLAPGTHTLQLELGDASHIPFDPPVVSKKITIHVE
ncbi:MAG TPA: DUF4399 domain-containing protein [Rhodanobacteraceae bacterium]|jgi:hypothetical protein|nr:DUF4399 domain-containing protein [Rhodanobacteraceae bacterium]